MKTVATSSLALFLTALCGASLTLSCRDRAGDLTAGAATEWAALERERTALEDLRSQLAEARAEEPPVPSRVETLETQAGAATDRFLERLVAFINEHADTRAGAATPPQVEAAIQAKSAEDLLVAREHIEGAGDYAKAIDILAAARVIDPDSPELAAAQAEAERMRFVDAESFGRIEKGMTEDEVRAELGQVKPQNVRPSPDGLVAWLYPREDGAAAAVFFHRGAGGSNEVYETNFEAVPSEAARAADEASRGDAVEARDQPAAPDGPGDD